MSKTIFVTPTSDDPDAVAADAWHDEDPSGEKARITAEIDALHLQWGSIDNDISELRSEQRGIEDRIVDLEAELEEIRKAPIRTGLDLMVEDTHWHCGSCSWETGEDSHSARFRAENHAHDTGHTVYLMTIGDVPGFDDPLADIAA